MGGRVWTLTQTDETLWYHVYNNQDKQKEGSDRKRRVGVSVLDKNTAEKRFKCAPEKEEDEPLAVSSVQNRELDEEMLRDYFQLDVRMGDLHKEWGAADCHFKHIAEVFKGQCVSLCLHSLATTYHLLHSKVLLLCFIKFHKYFFVGGGFPAGVRMLRQDPTECLFSFICTSNNHISRIQGMVDRLCQALGSPLCQLDQTSYHDFPSLSALAGA